MEAYEKTAAIRAGIDVEFPDLSGGWCSAGAEIADYLRELSKVIPAWRFWVRPGLAVAAIAIDTLVRAKCPKL